MLEASERINHDDQSRVHAAYVGAMSLDDAVHCQQQQQTVDARRPHPLLAGRTQADGAFSLAMRPAENVPVYVMLPLDTVSTQEHHTCKQQHEHCLNQLRLDPACTSSCVSMEHAHAESSLV